MKKYISSTVFIFFLFLGTLFSQTPDAAPFASQVGLNYQFYNDGRLSKIEGIGSRWRQFLAWHNLGYKTSTNDLYYDPNKPQIFYADIDPMNPSASAWDYVPSNFNGIGGINQNLQLLVGSDIELAYSAMSASHSYLTTNKYYSGGNWIAADPDILQISWRKPVPFILDGSGAPIVPAPEQFLSPNSYRFFAEFMSYYCAIFGTPDGNQNQLAYYNSGEALPGWFNHVSIFNEPDAHWTWPNDYGYAKPLELAALSHAAIGGNTNITTDIDGQTVSVGIKNTDSGMQIISPALHEMDMNYYTTFMNGLRALRNDNTFQFDINAFHHYSAYRVSELQNLFPSGSITPAGVVQLSVSESNRQIDYNINPNDVINTVTLESAPSTNTAYWVSPELDGYKLRGTAVRQSLDALNINTPIWLTEWGYATFTGANLSDVALYPPAYTNQDMDVFGGVAGDEEAQARWLMRGYIEYDASEFETSYWHWFQDGSGPTWAEKTGIIDDTGSRKPAWFYSHTMISEIGNHRLIDQHQLDICGEGDHYAAPLEVNGGNLNFIDPGISCPRIYQYTADSDCNGNYFGDYNETVYAIWLPYMSNTVIENVPITMAELGVNSSDYPIQYYITSPNNGQIDGENSVIKAVTDETSGDPNDRFITMNLTEKPVFLHLRGERPCNNTNQNQGQNGCSYTFTIAPVDIGCTSIQFELTLSANGANCNTPSLVNSLNSVIASIGSNNDPDEGDPTFTVLSEAVIGSSNNKFLVTMAGLTPGQDYNFSFGTEFQIGNDWGYIGGETQDFTTTDVNCFNQVTFDACDFNIIWNNAELTLNINASAYTDNDLSSMEIQSAIFQTANAPNSTASLPLPNIPFYDWQIDNIPVGFTHSVTIPIDGLSPDAEYDIVFSLTDSEDNIFNGPHTCALEIDLGDLPAGDGPGMVLDFNSVTTDNECLYNFCFDPVQINPGNYVTEYRLEVNDQNGNKIAPYINFSPQTPPYCFSGVDLSSLMEPPFVAQLVAINNGTTYGSFIDVPVCCGTLSDPLEVTEYAHCWSHYAYLDFCFDGSFSACNYTIEVTSDYQSHVITDLGNNCYSIQLYKQRRFECGTFDYQITIYADGSEVLNHTDIVDYTHCCVTPQSCCKPTPLACCSISQGLADMDVTKIAYPESGGLALFVNAPELKPNIQASQIAKIPVKYVINDLQTGAILNYSKYYGSVNLDLPDLILDSVTLNNRYAIHFLVNNEVYNLVFPNLPQFDSTFRLEGKPPAAIQLHVFPNPSSEAITVRLDNSIIKRLNLYNLLGEQVNSMIVNQQSVVWEKPVLNTGTYLLEVITEEGELLQHKVVFTFD